MYNSILTAGIKDEETMNVKKTPRGSNWSESQLFIQFDTGIYKIPCQIIYIPSYFIMPNNEMFLLITDGRQIYSVIQLFWNKPCPVLQADLLLCLRGSVKRLYSGIFLPPPQFSRTKMYLTCLTFHTSFLNLAVTTFFPSELWLALTLGRQRRPLPPPQLGKLLPKG